MQEETKSPVVKTLVEQHHRGRIEERRAQIGEDTSHHDYWPLKNIADHLNDRDELIVEYSHRNGIVGGRLYANRGYQKLTRYSRNFLARHFCVDDDVVNTYPNCVRQIFQRNGLACPKLENYCANRDAIIKAILENPNQPIVGELFDKGDIKRFFLVALHGGEYKIHSFLIAIDEITEFQWEVSCLSDQLMRMPQFKEDLEHVKANRKIKKKKSEKTLAGSFINLLAQRVEATILRHLADFTLNVMHLKVMTDMYDGNLRQEGNFDYPLVTTYIAEHEGNYEAHVRPKEFELEVFVPRWPCARVNQPIVLFETIGTLCSLNFGKFALRPGAELILRLKAKGFLLGIFTVQKDRAACVPMLQHMLNLTFDFVMTGEQCHTPPLKFIKDNNLNVKTDKPKVKPLQKCADLRNLYMVQTSMGSVHGDSLRSRVRLVDNFNTALNATTLVAAFDRVLTEIENSPELKTPEMEWDAKIADLIANHNLEGKKDRVEALKTQITRQINRKFTWINRQGGKPFSMEDADDHWISRSQQELVSAYSHLAKSITGMGHKPHNPFDIWAQNAERKCRDVARFDPSGQSDPNRVLNLFKGIAISREMAEAYQPPEPLEQMVAPILDHLRDVTCNGDLAAFEYFVSWQASVLQNLGKPSGVAVLIIGPQGAGKSCSFEHLKRIIGRKSFLVVHSLEHLTGQFACDDILTNIFTLLEECTSDKSAKQSSIMKNLLMAMERPFEPKYVTRTVMDNHTTYGGTTNLMDAIHIEWHDRRWLILQINGKWAALREDPERREEQQAYFDRFLAVPAIAWAKYLYARDLARFDIRNPPCTQSKRDQKLTNLDALDSFVQEMLNQSFVPSLPLGVRVNMTRPWQLSKDELWTQFSHWQAENSRHHRKGCKSNRVLLFNMLRTQVDAKDLLVDGRDFLAFPNLVQMRQAFRNHAQDPMFRFDGEPLPKRPRPAGVADDLPHDSQEDALMDMADG